MYGIFYNDDEFESATPAPSAPPPQPVVVIQGMPPVVDRSIPDLASGPSIVAPDDHELTVMPVNAGVARRTYQRSPAPEPLTDDERDERITMLLPLLRTLAGADIDMQVGNMMADVLRRGKERKSARKSST